MFVDTHAHLYWESFEEDFDEVLKRTWDAGVTTVINVGVDVEKSKEAAQVLKKLAPSGVEGYSTIGIHPHEALKYADNTDESIHKDMEKLEEIYKSNPKKVVAVGECGLDFLFESNPDWIPNSLSVDEVKNLQRKLFQAQIDLAKKLNLPLVVHCRDDRSKNPDNSECWEEVIEMTKDHFGIYHCYSGLPLITRRLPSAFLISFAATITYPKNEYLREAVKVLPLEKIVLETDSPFLPSQSKRGQRNEPQTILEIAQQIAQLKGVSFEEVAAQTTQNAKKVFKL